MALQRVCDIHDAQHEAVERTITVDGEPIIIDACDDYVTDLRNRGRLPVQTPSLNGKVTPKAKAVPAKAAVAAKKAVSTKRRPGSKPLARKTVKRPASTDSPCAFCPEVVKPSSFQGHAKTHGFVTAMEGYGDTCPLDLVKHGRLSNHAKEEHDLANVGQLFKAAVEAGDPHGIVAERRKLATNVS